MPFGVDLKLPVKSMVHAFQGHTYSYKYEHFQHAYTWSNIHMVFIAF